jgi:hypothetical protein
MTENINITVYLPAWDSQGSPTMLKIDVQTTRFGYDQGHHYDEAISKARDDGYTVPFPAVAFDDRDIKGAKEDWDKISYTLED